MNIPSIIAGILKMENFWDLFKGKERQLLEFQSELSKQLQELNKKQIDLNIQEAKHQNIFVSGWRPFIGWVCGSALAYQFILSPFIGLIFGLGEMPQLELEQLISILTAMLGMYGVRSWEKTKLKK